MKSPVRPRRDSSSPPPAAVRLLEWTLPDDQREAVLGDLEERFRGRSDPGSKSWSRRGRRSWFWRQALGLSGRMLWDRTDEVRHGTWVRLKENARMHGFMQDLILTVRSLRRRPAFALSTILTVALSVGAAASVFALVDGVILKPLPYPDPARLVRVFEKSLKRGSLGVFSPPNFQDIRGGNRSFVDMAAFAGTSATWSGEGEATILTGALVTRNFFQLLGSAPLKGRLFTAEEDQPAGPQALIISYAFWQGRLGGDDQILSRRLRLDGLERPVVGVMPRGFRQLGGLSADFWLPAALDTSPGMRNSKGWSAVARMRPGVGLEDARRDVAAVAATIAKAYPKTNSNVGAEVMALQDRLVGRVRPKLSLLFGAVACVAILALLNLANLHLAHGSARQGETAIRAALGAGRIRLIRQMGTESLLPALLGGMLGLMLAYWTVDLVVKSAPSDIPRLDEVAVNGRVVLFSFGASLLAALIFGVMPALRTSALDPRRSLGRTGREATSGDSSMGLRRFLVVLQMSLAVILLVGAGLLLQSFSRIVSEDLGFEPADILTGRISLGEDYPDSNTRALFFSSLLERIGNRPDVEKVGLGFYAPFSGVNYQAAILIPEKEGNAIGRVLPVAGDFFSVLGMRLMAGRTFEASDRAAATAVVVINETMARTLWPGRNAIGRRLQVGFDLTAGEQDYFRPRDVVGVVADVRFRDPARQADPQVFMPYPQFPTASMSFFIRTRNRSASSFSGDLNSEVRAVDDRVAVSGLSTLDLMWGGALAEERFYMSAMLCFALTAVALSALGVSGVLAYNVARRRGEIGIRMALGAGKRDVIRLIVGEGALLALVGTILGLAGAYGLSGFLSGWLHEVSPTDGLTFTLTALLLALVALAACYIPARRAAAIDPIQTLRES